MAVLNPIPQSLGEVTAASLQVTNKKGDYHSGRQRWVLVEHSVGLSAAGSGMQEVGTALTQKADAQQSKAQEGRTQEGEGGHWLSPQWQVSPPGLEHHRLGIPGTRDTCWCPSQLTPPPPACPGLHLPDP
jgi:hypothetical protein